MAVAGNGFPPKPGSINSAKGRVSFDWLLLPAEGRKGKAPALPKLRDWNADDRAFWTALWRKPQAVAWEQEGHHEFVARLVALRHDFMAGEPIVDKLGEAIAWSHKNGPSVSGEMRQLEDRLGLNPKALLGLRWRVVADEVAQSRTSKPAASGARERLRAV